jgi:hypothetical protein
MTVLPLAAIRRATPPRAKGIYYARALVALVMIAAWVVSGLTGLLLWLTPHGQGARAVELAAGLARSEWIDIHVVASIAGVALTLVHVTVMRRGALAYLRLVLTGRRGATAPARRPKPIVRVRALLVVGLLVSVPLVLLSGVIPWLAADGPRSGRAVLLFALTKRDWADVHTAAAMGALAVAASHVVVVRMGLLSDLRLLLTGRRSAVRPVAERVSPAA